MPRHGARQRVFQALRLAQSKRASAKVQRAVASGWNGNGRERELVQSVAPKKAGVAQLRELNTLSLGTQWRGCGGRSTRMWWWTQHPPAQEAGSAEGPRAEVGGSLFFPPRHLPEDAALASMLRPLQVFVEWRKELFLQRKFCVSATQLPSLNALSAYNTHFPGICFIALAFPSKDFTAL